MLRRALGLVFLFLICAQLDCRKAEGIPADPMDAEAEEALLGYIRVDTSNPPGNETAGAKYLQALLAKNGIESQLVGSDPLRQGLYARMKSGTNEPALVLMHHIDVVPAIPGEWTRPPFAGIRSNGYLWGRGALDVKGMGIAFLMAMVDLKRRGVPLKRDLIYLAVPDEELGGVRGAAELLEKRPELFENAGYVLNEGGASETVVDRIRFWGIEVQQKVPLWLRLETKGMPGHASSPPDDGGSLAKLVRALAAIDKIETPYRFEASVKRSFEEMGRVRRDERGRLLRQIKEPLDREKIAVHFGQGYRSLLHDTIAITRVSGGVSVNSIPERASADVDIRLLPDTPPEAMLARITEAAGKDIEVTVLLMGSPTPESSTDTDLYRHLSQSFREAEPGSVVGRTVVQGTTDSRYFRARGITAYGISPFKVNYYDADTVHAPDERIRARFFAEGVRLTRKIVVEFCAKSGS